MHEKYTTRGIVIGASAYREADKIISIYTEDFGLVSAVAAGVRRSLSKLRYHTQDYSVRQFSLVRGRDLWRLVGAEELSDDERTERSTSTKKLPAPYLAAYARVLSLIRRLVRGEEKNEPVFRTLSSMHDVLLDMVRSKTKGDTEDQKTDIQALETLAVFRILHDLGYIRSDDSTQPLVAPLKIDAELVALAGLLSAKLVVAINAGLTESHL